MQQPVTVDAELIICNPLPSGSGWTWTLASRLGAMLSDAEALFGPRDASYTILGIEFRDGVPQTWYPNNCRHIVVQLGRDCLIDAHQAIFQLAHECIHLLGPAPGSPATVLEEGLATYFSKIHTLKAGTSVNHPIPTATRYIQACSLVEQLLAIDSTVIRTMRTKQPTISVLTAADILDACPRASQNLATQLAAPFGAP